MFLKKFAVFYAFVFFVFSDASFVDNLPKCHLEDNECLRDLYETVIRDIGKHGIPDLNIPPVDPIRLTNVTVSVLNVVIEFHRFIIGFPRFTQLLLYIQQQSLSVCSRQTAFEIRFSFYAQRRDDGEIYIKCIYDLIKYDYEIQGKVAFFADNLYVGEQEISTPIIAMLNENWRFVMSGFGQPFVDKAMEFYFRFAGYFFDNVPARYYIIDDLSPYAKP
ncbi:hypothetical protein HF086_004828 [Spodoptera exigua]|uniref:Uncharacterized protein n=1 Tax=Spodoptera exigua TaxID=7107 RepID=A0A922SA32_SPOEX|nr:hypothetical protein HF086_004828 [Spodoptera exigua]